MRIAPSLLALLVSAAAASLLSSCSNATLRTNPPTGGGSGPGPAKTTPVINWSQPSPISNVTPLGNSQLNASANVSGTFAYTPAAGTVLATGSHTLSVAFTPADTSGYNTASATVTIQVVPSNQPIATSNFIYVSQDTSSPTLVGYSVAPNGALTPLPCAAVSTTQALSTVGYNSMLFGADGYSIYSYAIGSDGCLTQESKADVGQRYADGFTVGPNGLFLDQQHKHLYSWNFDPPEEGHFASYDFSRDTGQVTKTAESPSSTIEENPMLAFTSDGRFAASGETQFRGVGVPVFPILADGKLQSYSSPANWPSTPNTGFFPQGAAADAHNHVAVAGFLCYSLQVCGNGPWTLAVYSPDADGNLATSSTSENMAAIPSLADGASRPTSYSFSPDDRYFIVASPGAIDTYSWDDVNAVFTHLATSPIPQASNGPNYQLAWDSYDHLYAISGDQLFVYNVTDSGLNQAPGSPYAVQNPTWVTVVGATAP